ncbi:hypothetical protein IEQ34_014940 [Dendrobium chrysotoxum]|uniref:Replication protein A C-terminal domain-containing protein n=1 Tax=Dendrobium chrysotoxum TaxID=161865 RepID=A0AAV7GMV4_DENCH|nr:hypothetical protein IEQ34_014940 [Dendrobium chrysotoxum]
MGVCVQVKLLGIMMNKIERVTDVSFALDDGTGRINVNRWWVLCSLVNETSDTNEMAIVQNGMYVTIRGSLKGFQGKRQVVAYSVRPVIDFNEVTLHYLECIHVHLDNTRPKANTVIGTVTPNQNDIKGFQTPLTNPIPGMKFSDNEIQKRVLDVFMEPASLVREQGLHIDEVIRRLRFATEEYHLKSLSCRDAISYHNDLGHIYSTIDDFHFKSAMNG